MEFISASPVAAKWRNASLALALMLSLEAQALGVNDQRTPFRGKDISGVYTCLGNDLHDGNFSGTLTIKLDRKRSAGVYGGYRFTLVTTYDSYTGSIVSDGTNVAMDFANKDTKKRDYGISLGKVSKHGEKQVRIDKFYYQPRYQGGSNGFESCTPQ